MDHLASRNHANRKNFRVQDYHLHKSESDPFKFSKRATMERKLFPTQPPLFKIAISLANLNCLSSVVLLVPMHKASLPH